MENKHPCREQRAGATHLFCHSRSSDLGVHGVSPGDVLELWNLVGLVLEPPPEEVLHAVDVPVEEHLGVLVLRGDHLGEVDDDGAAVIHHHDVELVEVAVDDAHGGESQDEVHQGVEESSGISELHDILEQGAFD